MNFVSVGKTGSVMRACLSGYAQIFFLKVVMALGKVFDRFLNFLKIYPPNSEILDRIKKESREAPLYGDNV